METLSNATHLCSVYKKGFGLLSQKVMRDSQSPLLAKCIYAYLCAYAGNQDFAFPKQQKMKQDLSITQDTLTKYISVLEKKGYIQKQRTPRGNRYYITKDRLDETGYGKIPKLPLLDPNLTPQAKAIYAYLSTYAGNKNFAYPRLSTILRDLSISKDTYYAHFRSLTDRGYITVIQPKSGGRFQANHYFFEQTVPDNAASCAQQDRECSSDYNIGTEKYGNGNLLTPYITNSSNKNSSNKKQRHDYKLVKAEKKWDDSLSQTIRLDDLLDDIVFLKNTWPSYFPLRTQRQNHGHICDKLMESLPSLIMREFCKEKNGARGAATWMNYDRLSAFTESILEQADQIRYPEPYIRQAFQNMTAG